MSSEAAQKAYPDTENEAGSLSRSNAPIQREAFDRGAVEALRQAAQENYLAHGVQVVAVSDLLAMADEWERGSA